MVKAWMAEELVFREVKIMHPDTNGLHLRVSKEVR